MGTAEGEGVDSDAPADPDGCAFSAPMSRDRRAGAPTDVSREACCAAEGSVTDAPFALAAPGNGSEALPEPETPARFSPRED